MAMVSEEEEGFARLSIWFEEEEGSGSVGVGRSERGRLARMGLRGAGGGGTGEGEREGSFSLWADDSESESESLGASSGLDVVCGVVVGVRGCVRRGGGGRALCVLKVPSETASVLDMSVGRVFITTLEAEK